MPDTNIHDLIIEREGMVGALERLRNAGRLELLSVGEIEAIKGVPRRHVPAGVFVLDFARLDNARLGPGDA